MADIQSIFNAVDGTKATKEKIKMVLNMIFESAVEDGYIPRNPIHSRQLRITGKASTPTSPYSIGQMQFLATNLDKIQKDTDRYYMILQMMHPLRLEEVLGLKWCDLDFEQHCMYIRRAVTHPTRNRPEIKDTKTESSTRTLWLSTLMPPCPDESLLDEFIIGGKTPLSYQQVRKMCERIQTQTGFPEKITPIRFRTTALTDLYEKTKDITQVQAAARHTTAAMTLKHYVKGRSDRSASRDAIEQTYLAQ